MTKRKRRRKMRRKMKRKMKTRRKRRKKMRRKMRKRMRRRTRKKMIRRMIRKMTKRKRSHRKYTCLPSEPREKLSLKLFVKKKKQLTLMLSCFQERNLDYGSSHRPVLQMADCHRRPSILQPDDDCNKVSSFDLLEKFVLNHFYLYKL